ncbi:hypothetical protein SDC9_135007 [bioreactor metagenome]|uniref:Uncharacterized protein n=1 Tax=bioreactor metagenome TaxID=1076179 RepID=A0A645DEY6_9ZZZZ
MNVGIELIPLSRVRAHVDRVGIKPQVEILPDREAARVGIHSGVDRMLNFRFKGVGIFRQIKRPRALHPHTVFVVCVSDAVSLLA